MNGDCITIMYMKMLKHILLSKTIYSIIICNLWCNQSAKVKVEDNLMRKIEIPRGVHHGGALFPCLFNLYGETIYLKSLLEMSEGLVTTTATVNNIRYADDTVILLGILKEL